MKVTSFITKRNFCIALTIAVFIGTVLVAGCTGQSSTPATTPAPVATTTITVMENTGVAVTGTTPLVVAPAAANQSGNETAKPMTNVTTIMTSAPTGNMTAGNLTNSTTAK